MRIRMYRRPEESSSWYAQVYVGGRRYRCTCRTRDRATAHEYARRRTAELEGRHDRGLVGLPVGRITPTDIAAYLDRKAGTGLTARTVNLHRAILHRIFRLGVRP